MRHAFLAIAEKRHIPVIHTAASLRIFPKKRKMEGRKESPPLERIPAWHDTARVYREFRAARVNERKCVSRRVQRAFRNGRIIETRILDRKPVSFSREMEYCIGAQIRRARAGRRPFREVNTSRMDYRSIVAFLVQAFLSIR